MADEPYIDLAADSPRGFVRSLIPDIELLDNPVDPTDPPSYLFNDATLDRYLLLEKGNVKRAAAHACDALGTSEGLILKKITTDDLATDGSVLMREYGAKATRLRKEADDEEDRDEDNSGIISAPFLRHPVPFDAERAARRWW